MEKQLEILKALMEGKTVYDGDGLEYTLRADNLQMYNRRNGVGTYKIGALDQFTLSPPHKPLTFERIKKECVSGKYLLVDEDGRKRMFIGFNRSGLLVTDVYDGTKCFDWPECSIKDWTIEEYKGRE